MFIGYVGGYDVIYIKVAAKEGFFILSQESL